MYKKNHLSILLSVLLAAALLAGCGSASGGTQAAPATEPETAPAEGPVTGGWDAEESFALTDETSAVFAKAMEGLSGVSYEPAACLARQVVSGTNRAYFCRARVVYPDAKPYFAIVYVYEALDGGTEILGIDGITPDGRYDADAGSAEGLAGGWSVPESEDEGLAAFAKAAETLLGVDYTPVTVTGEQVVSGMNYCVLCQARTVAPEARPYYCFLHLYRDLQGNVSVQSTDILEIVGPQAA